MRQPQSALRSGADGINLDRPSSYPLRVDPAHGPRYPCPVVNDSYDLQRFVDAQAVVYDQVLTDLRQGRKRTHWMWFVFPQLAGLGHSEMARRYAIASREEAVAYMEHSIRSEAVTLSIFLTTRNSAPPALGLG